MAWTANPIHVSTSKEYTECCFVTAVIFSMKRPTFFLVTLMSAIAIALPTLSQAQTVSNASSYPAQERSSFINSCAYGRGAEVRAVCECTYRRITQQYNYEEYRTIYRRVEQGSPLPETIVAMIRDCRQAAGSR